MVTAWRPINFTGNNSRSAGSAHIGGMNASYVDGHVSFLRNAIDLRAYQGLASRSGGEVVNASEY
jgi:prepilin-type processing-associated H-X9-DG protein